MNENPRAHLDGASAGTEDEDELPARRPFTFASLGLAVATCVVWWFVAISGYFLYAGSRSDSIAVDGCTTASCPSQRAALLTVGYFGLLPTAFVGLLVSLVVLVYTARSVRVPLLLGSISALAGMVIGAIGFVTIATFDVTK